MNSPANVKQLVRKVLMETSAVYALVGAHVMTAHPRTADGAIEMPCLIVDFTEGGTGGSQGGWQRLPFDLYAYSRESDAQADTVYHAAYQALQMALLRDSTLVGGATRAVSAAGYAEEARRPDMGYNEQVGAWYARGKWIARTAG